MKGLPLVTFRRVQVPMPWWVVIWVAIAATVVNLLSLTVQLVWWLVRHYRSAPAALTVGGGVYVWARWGWQWLALVLALLTAVVAVWAWRSRASCWRFVLGPLLARWRRLWVYRRQWAETMTGCGLSKSFDGERRVPALLSVRCTDVTDTVVVRMLKGQNPEHFTGAALDLAYAFNVRHCRVFTYRPGDRPTRSGWRLLLVPVDLLRYRDRPQIVRMVFIRRDPLKRTVEPFEVPDEPDFSALPLGVCEDMQRYTLWLLATHVLIIGATRAGKGSVIWSLLRALAGGVASGLVRLLVIDPKGGVEMAFGRPMYHRYEDRDYTRMADLLDEAVAVMRERQTRLAGVVRVHTPRPDDPLYVVVVDELACLTAYLADGDVKKRISSSLGLLLSQGAGLGVLVVAASQDPRKEVVDLRDLFPTRIALRVNESNHVDLILGGGSRARGALADQIPIRDKGVGYVVLDDQPEPARVRFSYLTDSDIKTMAATYPAPAPAPAVADVEQASAPVPVQGGGDRPRHTYRPRQAAPLLPDKLLAALQPRPDAEQTP